MSAISSQLSFRPSPPWKISARILSVMDSIYAIAFGLGLRTLLDAVSQNFKLTGSLIGLWEGVITLHFLKKMPKSSDPYIAYGVRLFVDFLVTESVGRLVLVLIWTAFGMVLADVTPAIWDEVGLKRVWRHFRRDLYTIYDRIPTVAFFPPPRTVRFLPSREPSIITPSIATSHDTPITVIPPSSSVPSEPLKRRVPGYYPGDYSDTDTDRGSMIRPRPSPRTEVNIALGTTHYRLSTMPRLNPTYSVSDLDEEDRQSSAVSSSDSTEMGDPPSLFTQEDIPDMEEGQALVDIEEEIPDPTTPKQKPRYIPMPPTPSDSAPRWDLHRDIVDDVLHGKPRPGILPDIPDSMEDGATSDGWVKVQREELGGDRPPTPPAKDKPVGGSNLSIPVNPLPAPPVVIMNMNMGPTDTNPFGIDYSALDTFTSRQAPITTERQRESIPPPYDDYDDMYYNPPPSHDNQTATAVDDANINQYINNNYNDDHDDNDFANMASRQDEEFDINPGASSIHPPTSFDAVQEQADAVKEEDVKEVGLGGEAEEGRVQKEAERVRKEEEERVRKEEEERVRKEEEERVRKEEEEREAEQARKEADEKKKIDERAERKRKEDHDNALRKQRQAEEKKREEAEENKRKEEAEKKRKEEAEKKRKEEAEKKRKEEAEGKRRKEEAEKKRKDEEAEEKKRKEEAERKRKDDEAEETKRKEEAEKKRKDDEDQLSRKIKEVKQKEKEDEEAKENAEKQLQEDAAKKEQEKVEGETQEILDSGVKEGDKITPETEAQQAEFNEQKQEKMGDHEEQDDSKTVQHDQSPETQQQPKGLSLTTDAPNTTTSPPVDSVEEESVVSEATANPPHEAKERLERMMVLRAQMVELEKRLDQLKGEGHDEQSPEVKAIEKSLRKFRRQAERRYAAGIELAQHLQDAGDAISLEGLSPEMAEEKLEEKLEALLTPTSSSISISLTKGGVKQKSSIVNFMKTYNLAKFTKEVPHSKKAIIKIPKKAFANWLIDYRALVAERQMAEDTGAVFGGVHVYDLS